jgi:aminomethyltransferase
LRRDFAFTATTLTTTTSPVEANLTWALQKGPHSAGGAREGGFPGATRILRELADGPERHARRPAPRRPRADA